MIYFSSIHIINWVLCLQPYPDKNQEDKLMSIAFMLHCEWKSNFQPLLEAKHKVIYQFSIYCIYVIITTENLMMDNKEKYHT